MAKRRPGWLNSTILGIGLASFFADLSHEAVTALLPVLLASMGAAAGALGTIEGVADGASSLAKLAGGVWADRLRRRKPLVAAGYSIMAVAVGIVAFATSWVFILVARTASWTSRGIRSPAKKILLIEAATPETYGRAIGLERTMDTMGAVMAPLCAAAMLHFGFSTSSVIGWAMLPAFLAVAAIVFLVKEKPNEHPQHHGLMVGFRNLPKDYRKFLVAVSLFGSGDFATSLMILYATMVLTPTHGITTAATTALALFTLRNAVQAGISFPTGYAADRINKFTLLAGAYLIGVCVCLLLIFGGSGVLNLGLIFVGAGAYVGMQETLEDSIAADLLPKEIRGTGFGALAVTNGLGDMVSSIGVGWIWQAAGPAAAFACAGVMMSLGAMAVIANRPRPN